MDYKKKYKQLHNFISDLYPFMSEYCKEKVEGFLPELKESEDEKIRKELLEHCINRRDGKQICVDANDYRRWAAWLENQGKVNDYSLTMENEKIRKAIHIYLDWLDGRNKDYQPKGDYTIKDMIAWLEKIKDRYIVGVDMGIPTGDKGCVVDFENKPKFKVGDWIYHNKVGVYPILITDYDEELGYQTECLSTKTYFRPEFVEKEYHLWTIQDAKDGDVLVESNCNAIIMFRGVGNIKWDDVIDYHCYYNCHQEDFIVQEGGSHWCHTEDCTLSPATKEQRDTLFTKMKESGYEWDADNQELKKIEQKSTERSLSYEKNETAENLIALAECLEMDGDCLFNGLSGDDYGKLLRVLAIELTEVKPAWSEEDEKCLSFMIECLETCSMGKQITFLRSTALKYIDWLKSLKDRILK